MNSLFQPIRAGLCFQIQLGKGPLRPVNWFNRVRFGLQLHKIHLQCIYNILKNKDYFQK